MVTSAFDEAALLENARSGDQNAFAALAGTYQGELRSHCYRMLGSVQDAEDAVQNALLRAWRGLDKFEGRSSVRTWLYAIATNTTLDITRHRSRRELPADFGPAGTVGEAVAEEAVNDPIWLEPYPDQWLSGTQTSPESRYEQRESVEIAFMILLQELPPLQRAVLILRDVLGFSAAEVAVQLETSVASVTSALQRARSTAQARLPERSQQETLRALGDRAVADLAHRYATALETGDVDALLGLLTEDATWCMPPYPTWFQGHEALRAWLVRDPLTVRWRHQTSRANGQLAVGCYLFDSSSGRYLPHVIDVLTLDGAKVAAVTAFVFGDDPDPAGIFASFGLPQWLP
ncbi:MAG: sigma-70 family RNA polymerase sigma factor [Trebonia sp.]|jgi:RNA polymerase sigma-70 factor (ECF subfamily)